MEKNAIPQPTVAEDPRDRRRHPRLEGQFRVDLLNMGNDPAISQFEPVVEAEALDVSRSGMRLKVNYHVPVGTLLSVIIYYKNFESLCLCKVMWRRDSKGELIYGLLIDDWCVLDVLLERQLSAMEAPPVPSAPALITPVVPA